MYHLTSAATFSSGGVECVEQLLAAFPSHWGPGYCKAYHLGRGQMIGKARLSDTRLNYPGQTRRVTAECCGGRAALNSAECAKNVITKAPPHHHTSSSVPRNRTHTCRYNLFTISTSHSNNPKMSQIQDSTGLMSVFFLMGSLRSAAIQQSHPNSCFWNVLVW